MAPGIKEAFGDYYNFEPFIGQLPKDTKTIADRLAGDFGIPLVAKTLAEELRIAHLNPDFRGIVMFWNFTDQSSDYKFLGLYVLQDLRIPSPENKPAELVYFSKTQNLIRSQNHSMGTFYSRSNDFGTDFPDWIAHHASFDVGCDELDRLEVSWLLEGKGEEELFDTLTDTNTFQACPIPNRSLRAYIIYR